MPLLADQGGENGEVFMNEFFTLHSLSHSYLPVSKIERWETMHVYQPIHEEKHDGIGMRVYHLK